ncbi:MAG: hypothetical protein LBU44_03095 [Mediterranea sp.]|nr:hypothetical protein [Mediterranea sp.]
MGVAFGPGHPLQVLASLHFVPLRSGLSAPVLNAAAPSPAALTHVRVRLYSPLRKQTISR